MLAGCGRLRRGDGGRGQPHPPGCGAGRRHPRHRLPDARDRRGGCRAPAWPRPRRRSRPGLGGGIGGLRQAARRDRRRRGDRDPRSGFRGARRFPLPVAVHLGHDRAPQGGALHPGAPGRHRRVRGTGLRLSTATTCATAPCPCSTATPSWRCGPRRSTSGRRVALRPRFSASAFIDDVRRYRATTFSYVGKALAYILATPERPDDGDNTLRAGLRHRGLAAGSPGSSSAASVAAWSRATAERGGFGHQRWSPGRRPGSLGRPVGGAELAVVDPVTAAECPRAVFDGPGKLLNGRRGHRRDRQPGRHRELRGLLREPGGRGRPHPPGLVLDGRPRLPRRGRVLLLRRAERGLAARSTRRTSRPGRSSAVLDRHPDVAVAAVYPVPDTVSGDQVMAALELRHGAGLRSRPVQRSGSASRPISAPSGRRASCGSRPRCPRRPPAR